MTGLIALHRALYHPGLLVLCLAPALELALLDLCFAAYVLVRWTHTWARESVDRVVTAPAPHHVPRIVAYRVYEIVAWAG